jgi:hypothetical protein
MLSSVERISHFSRWTARFLVLAMIAPALVPVALARSTELSAPHCLRQRMSARPAMPCHDGMAESKSTEPESNSRQPPETSFQANYSCCQNHDCCCRIGNSGSVWLASVLSSSFHPLIGRSSLVKNTFSRSKDVFGQDSARAPPRS